MKTLIIHDRFMFRGGAERLVLVMAKEFNADILTEFWVDGETYDRSEAPGKIFTLAGSDLKIEALRYFRAQFNFLFRTRQIIKRGDYDLVIFSGNNCLSVAFNLKKNQKKFLYCHAPVRHVFDLYKKNRAEQKNILKKILYYYIGVWFIRAIYLIGLSKFKTIVVNSKNIQTRVKKYCHRRSQVVYPPIDTKKFVWLGQKDYYLSFGRVDELKRVPDIVKAFQKMPDKKLVITSSGSDFEKVKEMSKNFPNIQVLGWVNGEQQKKLVGNCIASIYLPIDEDFGMVPVESMSAGKPCVVNQEGGFLETVQDEVNGKFVPKDYTIEDIQEAVRWMSPDKAASMKESCSKSAEQFSQENFNKQIRQVVKDLTF